ncbi:Ribonuclease HII [Paraliobacillus sp. PM-2]|uniref:ribonuclease HII n=1 Tax=Paraliobacillus sp. PM-2 TaxID=1462524 RepID=UPI00061C7E2D|nr:ribonuclease HII [Paraliobacillus sp. PM-2]CQR47714.1 Ribonuclease HII [Paraliobacillus sp. PM-2]
MASQKSVKEIKQSLVDNVLTQQQLQLLHTDKRKGVQIALNQYYKRLEQEKKLKDQFNQMMTYERKCHAEGKKIVVGIDEVGRGPLAGPVVAAAVVLDETCYLPGINDSKKMSRQKREFFYEKIQKAAVSYSFGIIDNKTIDKINIYQATIKAMKQAIGGLSQQPDHLLIDAMDLSDLPYSSDSIIKGDQKSVSIAAASILAKVKRDYIMAELHHQYPNYDFEKNQGYGTKAHLDAIKNYGITPYHRQSFAPIKK